MGENAVTANTRLGDHATQEAVVVSVIIPSFNSKHTAAAALRALAKQKTRHRFEIIFVDSSNDGTPDFVAKHFPEVTVVRLSRQTYPGIGRNIGIENARGRFVAFTDADCEPKPDWLDRIVETFEATGADAVGGSLINGYPRSPVAWVSHLIEFNEWTETSPAGFVKNIPSANLAYRRETFLRLDEWFPNYLGSEDTVLNTRMRAKGAKLYFDPKIQIVHLNRSSLGKLLRHSYMLGSWSGYARRHDDLSGAGIGEFKFMALVIPFMRLTMALWRLLRKDKVKFCILAICAPLYLAAAFAWSFGFVSKRDMMASAPSQNKVTAAETAPANG